MNVQKNVSFKYSKVMSAFLAGAIVALGSATHVSAEPISPDVQAKVEHYKAQLTVWAANPAVIAAVKSANVKGGLLQGMTNLEWEDLKDNNPMVADILNSDASKFFESAGRRQGYQQTLCSRRKRQSGGW